MAPQLRQSLKILQVATLDLQHTIQEELESNPLLEELPLNSISIEDAGSRNGDSSSEQADGEQEGNIDSDFEVLRRLSEDSREDFASSSSSYTQEDAKKRQHFFDSLVSETSLQEHLMEQAELSDCSDEEKKALQYLIGSLDDRGFLTAPFSELALYANLPLETVQQAGALLRTFDPPGIGCSDLKDSLLQQLHFNGKEDTLAATIISQHFDLLVRRRIPEIARKLATTTQVIQKTIEEIAILDPAPGRRFSDDNNQIVIPDVIVERNGDDFSVEINNDYIPRLRISNAYKEMIAAGKLSSKEKEYIRTKMRAGKFLISSIEQRQQTIERITRQIIDVQKEFFNEGVSKLRPLTMTQIADRIGVHETTVSRALSNKYMKTPHGVFEFKFFFTPGYQSEDGNSLSNKSIKDTIASLIESESPHKPFSDQEIVNILKSKHIEIARRTVAKYRENMGILSAKLRREY